MKNLVRWIVAVTVLSGGALLGQEITGTWQGTLQAGRELRMVIKVRTAANVRIWKKEETDRLPTARISRALINPPPPDSQAKNSSLDH